MPDDGNLPIFAFVHDLRQPLRAIVTQSQMLLRRPEAQSSPISSALQDIVASARLQEGLMASVLEFSEIDASGSTADPLPLSLVIQGACRNVEKARIAAGGKINTSAAPSAEVPSALSKVVEKLVDNALKFHRAGSPPCVTITAVFDGKILELEVCDEGLGVPPEYRSAVFSPFKRLNNVSEFPGHGMGLAICQRIVGFLNGEIAFADPPNGQGARVVVRIPAHGVAA